MGQSVIQRTFAGGELAPVLHARADQAKYLSGLRTCLNMIVRKEGGVTTRPGFRFISACKDDIAGKRLMANVSSTPGACIFIEIGNAYLRFYADDGEGWAPILVSSVPAYVGATTYNPGDLVSSAGVNYYCVATTTGNAPPDAAFWHPLVGAVLEVPTLYPIADVFKWNQSGNVITLTHRSHTPRELVFLGVTR